jgi:hypothetical protein
VEVAPPPDSSDGLLGQRALRAAVLVVVAIGVHDRDVRPGALGLVAAEEQLAGLPLGERDADRARERDVERDPQLDVLAARGAELARRDDRVLGPRRRDDDRAIVLEHDERAEDPRPFDRDVLDHLEPDRRFVENDRGPSGLHRQRRAQLPFGRVAQGVELRGHRMAAALPSQRVGQTTGVDHALGDQELPDGSAHVRKIVSPASPRNPTPENAASHGQRRPAITPE